MRESISGTALFLIVIFFVVLFTGYLCLSINKSRAFAVKNSIVRIIERYGTGKNSAGDLATGASGTEFSNDIRDELRTVGYNTTHVCPTDGCNTGWVGFNTQGTLSNNDPNSTVFCVCYVPNGNNTPDPRSNPTNKLHYYKVTTFYNFNLPIVGGLIPCGLTVEVTTKPMMV
jgi:hypothetical protein